MSTTNRYDGGLKELMAEWKLENILSHLHDENIDLEVLEMMKISHIRLLLYNFSLGIQIRFEYNLERWRRSMGKPLLQAYIYDERNPVLMKERHETDKINLNNTKDFAKCKTEMQNKITQTDLMIVDTSQTKTPTSNEDSADLLVPTTATSSKQVNDLSCSSTATLSATDKKQPTLKSPKPVGVLPKVDLRQILSVVPYGVELANKYRERKTFTNPERRQLISVIVNYYMDNNIKFNQQTSYALERAIFQMFPNEKSDSRGRLYMKFFRAKAAMNFLRTAHNDLNENSNMDFSAAAGADGLSNDNFSDDSQMSQFPMVQLHNSTVSNMAQIDDDDDCFMEDDGYTIDFIGDDDDDKPVVVGEEDELHPQIKIEAEKVTELTHPTPPLRPVILSTELLFNRRKPEEDDRPFENFEVPWHKIPTDILTMMQKHEKLGKRLNVLANLFVSELRNISTHVPMRVFRNVTQQVVTRYPYSFLDRDSEGNIIASATIPLLQRMRNRNNFLNRPDNKADNKSSANIE